MTGDVIRIPVMGYGDVWRSASGSPFEVMFKWDDPPGTIHLRWNNDVVEEWFEKMLERAWDKRQAKIAEAANAWKAGYDS